MHRIELKFGLLLLLALAGCTEEKNYITNGPTDWQPPVVEWRYQPDAEVRGTVGIDVTVTDSSEIAGVALYVDGILSDSLFAPPYRFEIITDSLPDGVHVCEARAWDEYGNLGISPILRINVMNSMAEGPRLIWVPDDFTLIQAAINAATDYDTIRVRDGIYYEALNTFGKAIWLESEGGPLTTTVDGQGTYNTLIVSASSRTSTVRGFCLTSAAVVVRLESGALLDFMNNIVYADTTGSLFRSDYAGGDVRNNLFDVSRTAVEIGYTLGRFSNNIVQNAAHFGLWNAAIYRNPLSYGYNLFWENRDDYFNFEPGEGDIHADPLIDWDNGELFPESPCVNNGDPSIIDRDGTRSDIGPFGGPWAYVN